ncbi:MAG TPA: cyclic nucleotide-binding domain-containing protein [Candidatus Limnocylindrales bacterium]|nr:cyclic nucleotide-binding domain-containing protein [Candidatus Limnocylindrales bacterium]
MRERARVVLSVARDATLLRIELAYLGFTMSEAATWMAILVYAYGVGGAGLAAVFAAIQLVPAGILAPMLAAAGDRRRREVVLRVGYLAQASTMAATALALASDAHVVVVAASATLAAVSVTITRPVQAAILPGITHSPGDLTAANAVSGLVENLGTFAGPLVGGLLLLGSEPAAVFATFAAVSMVGALLVSRLPTVLDLAPKPAPSGPRTALGATFAGMTAVRTDTGVLVIVILLAALDVAIGALDVLYVAAAIELLGAGEAGAGFLYAAFGLGGIVAIGLTVALVGRRRMTPAFAGGIGLFGAPVAAVGLAPWIVTAPILFAASGAGYSLASVAGRTLLQRVAPEVVLARVFGVLEGLSMFALALGSLTIGGLIAVFGVGGALIAAGILVPVVVVVAWLRLAALDRHARAPDPEALALLRAIPIFAPLSAPSMERILGELSRVDVPAGAELIREGEPGDRFYVIAEGRVAVSRSGIPIREEGPGEYVGEIALLRDVPRTATVTALTPVRVIAIERERFLEAVTGHARSRERAEAVVERRMLDDD